MAANQPVFGLLLVLLLAMLSPLATALQEARDAQITAAPEYSPHPPHSCYSYTETVQYTGIVHCPKLPICGPHPMCIIQEKSIIEVPCAEKKCPHTPTVTITAPPACPTCQKGCATAIMLETITTGCPSATPS